jgi:hypothetical protein
MGFRNLTGGGDNPAVFVLRSESIKTFINDRTIRLPRFQRKQTWGSDKNFNLAISVFKDYPIGVVVVKLEQGSGRGKELEKWLLDGRQRLNALQRMKNPEELYDWAKSALHILAKDTEDEVREAFWRYVDEYLEGDELGEPAEEIPAVEVPPVEMSVAEDEEAEEADVEVTEDVAASSDPDLSKQASVPAKYEGLQDLLDLILIVHPLRKASSGFTRPFDFHKEISDLEYIKRDVVSGKEKADSDTLIAWIDAKKRLAEINGKTFPPSEDDFYAWLTQGRVLKSRDSTIKDRLHQRWTKILKILGILDDLDTRLQEAKIGYLELTQYDDNDAKKIFEILNTAGVQLTAAEILSAKPSWNRSVRDPHADILRDKDKLYKEIGVTPTDLVRWDIPATLLDRLKLSFVLGKWE